MVAGLCGIKKGDVMAVTVGVLISVEDIAA